MRPQFKSLTLTIKDLNQVLLKLYPEHTKGVLDACNLVNDMYSSITMECHKYLLGDCVLAKLNLLKKGKKIRKNPFWKEKPYEYNRNHY
jgi:hypothetical protein